MTTIKLADDGVLTIELPGLTAVRIDTGRRLIAIDGVSGDGRIGGDWTIADLRGGTYGGFHRLLPAGECFDAHCAGRGEHASATPGEGGELFHGMPRAGDPSMRDFTCGSCGEQFGSNCSPGDIECPYCNARLCSRCGNWEGAAS